MNRNSDQEPLQVKRPDLSGCFRGHRGKHSGDQQMHGIPDAVAAYNPVQSGQQCHRRSTGKATLDAGGNWIDLDRQPCARDSANIGDVLNAFARCLNSDFFLNYWRPLEGFHGQDLAEPAHSACSGQYRA